MIKKTITQILANAIDKGHRCQIDFRTHTLSVNRKRLVNQGVPVMESGLPEMSHEEAIAEIERLYHCYRHSLPSVRSKRHGKTYFTCLPEDKLDKEDFLYGEERENARIRLEATFLLMVVDKRIDLQRLFPDNHWFWQSTSQPDLIILKEWTNL